MAEIADRASISAVNLAEAVTKLIQKGGRRDAVEKALRGLSLGGRACLTLAKHSGGIAVTADCAWRKAPVKTVMIR